ncbi:MAG TPA: hypothetical protein VGN63_04195 [Flavisolibacter sp.]|nr:hypothetical protein [Flavisolibacter sp.]
MPADRIATDPAFARTRENGAEFGRAGKGGKLLRNALRGVLQRASDGRVVSRLTKEMMRVIKADSTSARGMRNVVDGEAELLTGFDFNLAAKLGATLHAPYTASIDRATGACAIELPSFVPMHAIAAPGGTTHFQLFAAAAAIDFEGNVYTSEQKETALLPWDVQPTAPLQLAHALPANSPHPLFLLLGIAFYQEVNGSQYPLQNGTFNALAVVRVNGG